MAVNRDRPDFWKEDIAKSVDFYNKWFIEFAPWTYRDARQHTTEHVKSALALTKNLTDISSPVLKGQPYVVQILRMTTAPPIARDRLMGLSGVPPLLISSMEEKNRIPPKMKPDRVDHELAKIGRTIEKMLDKDLFPWIETEKKPSKDMIYRGATVVADRLTGAVANPIIRNAQERRQLAAIKKYLENRGYQHIKSGTGIKFSDMSLATFAFRLNVPVKLEGGKAVNIPVDVAIRPKDSKGGDLPLLVEAKSAGDFTNVNKRRKEEAAKMAQLRATYGREIRYVLFLCGYFDTGYLGYEAAEGIDWIWEHRIDDFVKLGV